MSSRPRPALALEPAASTRPIPMVWVETGSLYCSSNPITHLTLLALTVLGPKMSTFVVLGPGFRACYNKGTSIPILEWNKNE